MAQFKQKRRRKRSDKRVARIVAIIVVFGLIAALFIGTFGIIGARASTLTSTPSINCVADIDGDGALNGVDPDIDGDGIINAEDDDMDGDGISNFKDQDPAGTNCTVEAPLPQRPKIIDDSSALYIGLTVVGIAVAAPLAFFYARSKRRK
ncbi:unannotated protein [freshwater metagenome]|uniref:Unannotated protein n=1 Tax=freshwater metagenome TaxID=449393 RepID=A0A6J7JVI1_9ZZZZ|nr:hypothetical protein [Actinomycetota bacterium]